METLITNVSPWIFQGTNAHFFNGVSDAASLTIKVQLPQLVNLAAMDFAREASGWRKLPVHGAIGIVGVI
jgi:hypothetical protein